MLSGPFLSKNWMGSCDNFQESEWVIVGLPYDGTCSYRPGTRFAPEMIRLAFWGLESYSPYQDKELDNIKFYDAGELDLPYGNRDKCLEIIANAANETLNYGKKWLGIGGEHLVTYPAVMEYIKKYPNLALVHFDAHTDLRDDYLGEKLSHATVIRRLSEHISPERILQMGIRSGLKEEFEWMKKHKTLIKDKSDILSAVKKISGCPVFITIDIDVLDPSIVSGTGTPEPGGMSFNEFLSWLMCFKDLNIVGADVVELSPHYDSSGVSTIVAAKAIRELLLLSDK